MVHTPIAKEQPHWSEIDTPWERRPIAWRLEKPEARDAAYGLQIADPANTHLVREVLVHSLPLPGETGSSNRARTMSEAEDAIAEVLNQFDHLESCGLKVPPEIQWHIFESEDRTVRTLARVAIIDGEQVSWPESTLLRQHLATYRQSGAGLVVGEFMNNDQYLQGLPRSSPEIGAAAFYLVDIDPASWDVLGR